MLSSLIESLGSVSAGEHIQAAGGGLVAVAGFLLLLLLCCAGGNKGDN